MEGEKKTKPKQPELSAILQSVQTSWRINQSSKKWQSLGTESWNNNCTFIFFPPFLQFAIFFQWKVECMYHPFSVERACFNEYYLSTQGLSHFIQI